MQKGVFLKSLYLQKLRYKRYTKSPLRYGGGKSLAVGLILEYMPDVNKVLKHYDFLIQIKEKHDFY
ncbi:hypothetical protein [Helicobacter suis]|uniref:hypothetical protein n=1 Tax=Helicobacter suis TaxID=104628 RepID=UPI001F07FB3C|nr:hypothetical protein [Helicobacter suis]